MISKYGIQPAVMSEVLNKLVIAREVKMSVIPHHIHPQTWKRISSVRITVGAPVTQYFNLIVLITI